VLEQEEAGSPQDPFDIQLYSYGNDLMHSMLHVIQSVHIMLSRLSDQRLGMLSQSERVIITPFFDKVSGNVRKLTQVITELQIHKSTQQDEK